MTESLINTQITIITYLLIGFLLYKVKMIDNKAQLFMSDMTIDVLLPCSVFASFVSSMTVDLLVSLATVLIFAIVLETALYLVTKIPSSKLFDPSEESVLHYSELVSNGGLVGTPVVESLFGPLGVMYCNVFMIPTRIMAFSAGESIFNPAIKKNMKDIVRSVSTNKVLLAMLLGLAFVFLKIKVPAPVFSAIQKTGACLSPFSLILVGSMLAQKIHLNLHMMKGVSLIVLIRLILIPLAALSVCLMMKLDFMSTAVIVLLMGMPVGMTCASFAKKYRGNEEFASMVVLVTTLLSTVTLVMMMGVIEMFF
ncbi:MAG: AEC family transporter [Erysipelotrichaceae bacterium]|nr:AEC family transporter [Erysipelotrichaceae bacterium]